MSFTPAHSTEDGLEPPPVPEAVWYYLRDGQRSGPVAYQVIRYLASSGQLSLTDLVWRKGLTDWIAAASLQGLITEPMVPVVEQAETEDVEVSCDSSEEMAAALPVDTQDEEDEYYEGEYPGQIMECIYCTDSKEHHDGRIIHEFIECCPKCGKEPYCAVCRQCKRCGYREPLAIRRCERCGCFIDSTIARTHTVHTGSEDDPKPKGSNESLCIDCNPEEGDEECQPYFASPHEEDISEFGSCSGCGGPLDDEGFCKNPKCDHI
jgi:hypothetical protein